MVLWVRGVGHPNGQSLAKAVFQVFRDIRLSRYIGTNYRIGRQDWSRLYIKLSKIVEYKSGLTDRQANRYCLPNWIKTRHPDSRIYRDRLLVMCV